MTNETQFAEPESDAQVQLCEDFDLALHSMAQPLTVLRGALGALALRGSTASDADRYVELSNKQVDRICNLMSGMRGLVDAVQFDAVCTPTTLWELIGSILDREASEIGQAGLRISTEKTDDEVRILADPFRVEHAVKAVLRVASSSSSNGGEICLSVDRCDGFAELMIQHTNGNRKELSSIDRVYLSLAEANIRSQRGLFRTVADPFSVSMKLPLCDVTAETGESSRIAQQAQPT